MNMPEPPQRKNVIVLTIDRLGAGYLGPYGNTWFETRHWNRLAAESLLFETALTDSLDLTTVFRSYWRGCHACRTTPPAGHLASILREHSLASALISDDERLGQVPSFDAFDEQLLIAPAKSEFAAEDLAETQFARLMASAIDWLDSAESPFMLWIHSRGMQGEWDAPAEYRNRFAEEDDPLPPAFTEPPSRRIASDEDPDDLLGLLHAYAGQITLVDECLGALLNHIASLPCCDNTLLIVTSPRGFPLGEHGQVGEGADDLNGELVHVPLLLKVPAGDYAAVRELAIVQPPDIFATILDWFGLPIAAGVWGQSLLRCSAGDVQRGRDRAYSIAGEHRAIRTPAWFLHLQPDGTPQLYTKPDDRWEANEVSNRCRQIAEDLSLAMNDFQAAANEGNPVALAELGETLIDGPV